MKLWLKNGLRAAEVAQVVLECALVWVVTILFKLSFFGLNCQEEHRKSKR